MKILLLCALWISTSYLHAQSRDLPQKDIVLIKEAFNLQTVLGQQVWEAWLPEQTPFLFKKGDYEYLINHKDPPSEYQLSQQKFNTRPIYWKERTDTLDLEATFDVNSLPTVVMTAPYDDENITTWLLKAAHEMFHVFQFNSKKSEPLETQFDQGKDDDKIFVESELIALYSKEELRATLRLEADRIFTGISINTLSQIEKKLLIQRLGDIQILQSAISKDSALIRYKSRMEWTEGVARYVETQLAIRASNSKNFMPSSEFTDYYPEVDFQTIASRYSQRSAINPIRFVGGGVKGRLMFYYMGMGKAYLLDRIEPDWKDSYFEKTLDEQISGKE